MRTHIKILSMVITVIMTVSSFAVCASAGGLDFTGSETDFDWAYDQEGRRLSIACKDGDGNGIIFVHLNLLSPECIGNIDYLLIRMSEAGDYDRLYISGSKCTAANISLSAANCTFKELNVQSFTAKGLSLNISSNAVYERMFFSSLGSTILDMSSLKVDNMQINGCDNLMLCELPDSLKNLQLSECKELEEIVFPEKMDEVFIIGTPELQFVNLPSVTNYCSVRDGKMKDITIPESGSMYMYLDSIQSATIADGRTELNADMFFSCPSLKEITIPVSVTSINDHFINEKVKLNDVYYLGTEEQWNKIKVNSASAVTLDELFDNVAIHFITMQSGWVEKDGSWYYYENNQMVTGWKKISTVWYYFDADGVMQKGWQKIDNTWYYFGDDGYMRTDWRKIRGGWYYFKKNGSMAKDWQKIDGIWYYFGTDGMMRKGWQSIGGVWYYFDNKGEMKTGWELINNKWYFFGSSGAMVTGWKQLKGKWYYFESSGAMVTGWKQINAKWYYLNSSGAMETGWQQIDGKWYYFNDSGSMQTGFIQVNGKKYHMEKSGQMSVYWFKDNGLNYYADPDTGELAADEFINGYYYDENGVGGIELYKWEEKDGYMYYVYWFEDGKYVKSRRVRIDGLWYEFDKKGRCIYSEKDSGI